MIGEIIAIGDELTSGRILNTNSRFAAGQLFTAGHEIVAMATVGDTAAEIGSALKRALKRADFIIVIGGLGPTSDDCTNEAVSQALERPATLHSEILEKIQPEPIDTPDREGQNLEKLAWLPAGAEVLKPESTIAGYMLVHTEKPLFFLPGIPHQMKELMADRVIPRLTLWQGGSARHVIQQVFKVFGLPETEINQQLLHLEEQDEKIRLGYYPVFPDVHVSLTVIDNNTRTAREKFAQAAQMIQDTLADAIYGADDDSMAAAVGKLLVSQGKTLAVAESCTGGLIAHKLTSVSGSSDYFAGGVVAYSNSLKEHFLDVASELLEQFGAVSAPVARAMAAGVGTDIGIAVTGVAGPTGGSREKPVGTVFFGLATEHKEETFKFHFTGNRKQVQEISAQTGLDLVRRLLLDKISKEK
jgi:nicotinamide-nucleotide amidase